MSTLEPARELLVLPAQPLALAHFCERHGLGGLVLPPQPLALAQYKIKRSLMV